MSHFTKVMLSAASGVGGGEETYGSFGFYSNSERNQWHKIHGGQAQPLKNPSTSELIMGIDAYSSSRVVANLVAYDLSDGTTTLVDGFDAGSGRHTSISQIIADPSENGDYYVVVNNSDSPLNIFQMDSKIITTGSSRSSGSEIFKYNKDHVEQWNSGVRSNLSSDIGYGVFIFFHSGKLHAVHSSSVAYDLTFLTIDTSDGTYDSVRSRANFGGTQEWSRQFDYYSFNARIYDTHDSKVILAHKNYNADNYTFYNSVEQYAPSNTSAGYTLDYAKYEPEQPVTGSYYIGSLAVDDTNIYTVTTQNLFAGFHLFERSKSNGSVTDTRKYTFSGQAFSGYPVTNCYGTKILIHPEDDTYIYGMAHLGTTSGTFAPVVLFKINKSTKAMTIINAYYATNDPQCRPLHMGYTTEAVIFSFQYQESSSDARMINLHLALSDLDAGTWNTSHSPTGTTRTTGITVSSSHPNDHTMSSMDTPTIENSSLVSVGSGQDSQTTAFSFGFYSQTNLET